MDQGITVRRASISSRAAQRAVAAAVEQGRRLGCRMNAAVVDAGGNLLAFLRDDGAFLHSIHIAQDKAYTAAGFGMSTSALHDAVKDPPVLREGIARRDRLVLFGGVSRCGWGTRWWAGSAARAGPRSRTRSARAPGWRRSAPGPPDAPGPPSTRTARRPRDPPRRAPGAGAPAEPLRAGAARW